MSLLLAKLLPSWWSRAAVAALAVLALAGFVFAKGVWHERAKWEAAAERAEHDYLLAVQRAARVEDHVVEKFVDRWHTVTKHGATIIKEVPVYVTAAADDRCVVPRGFVRVHDAAVQNRPLSGSAGSADEAPAGVALSAVADTVAANYGTYHEVKTQCEALQEWLRETRSALDGR